MTISRIRPESTRPWDVALLPLVPWVAFLLSLELAGGGANPSATSADRVVAAALYALGFVALPSALPVFAARTGRARAVVVALMTAVATAAGILVVTTDDAQAGLAVLWVPFVAVALAVALWLSGAVAARRTGPRPDPGELARPADRLAALAIDVAVVGAALVAPLTVMSHAGLEVAAVVVGVAGATIYMAALVAGGRRTIGQSLLGLAVVDARTRGQVPLARALLRGLIVVVEVAALPTLLIGLGIAELSAAAMNGRSLTDRLLGTSVVTTR